MTRSARHIRRLSRRQRAALGGLLTAGALLAGGVATPNAEAVTLIQSDLEFMLTQIKIAEAHAAQPPGTSPLGPGPLQVASPLLPFGLRTVDGKFNNLVAGQEGFGAADSIFPRLVPLTPSSFRDAEPFDPDGPGPAPATPTSYIQTSGIVADSKPRVISNLLVDQTPGNPAAVAAAAANPNAVTGAPGDPIFLPNVATDAGLSAPYNSWFTFFGQFFDHGLDLLSKGGNGTVMVPLQPDDPLFNGASPETNFMVVTRATNQAGSAGAHKNTTTPFVDQNQTYTSHPSHQVFLREYELRNGRPVATGKMLDRPVVGGLPRWIDVKDQARVMLGITLDDQDLLNVPKLLTDPYGKFIPAASGFAQLVTPGGPVSGTPGAPVDATSASRTDHAFLDDIAHTAAPSGNQTGLPGGPRGPLVADPDTTIGLVQVAAGQPQRYDNELLDAHFITGDGRGNENVGLTTVHHIFHAEHNRLVEQIKTVVSQDPVFLTQWQISPGIWNGERLFQAARFATEMQYQHLVFEEFGRKVQPAINIFAGYNSTIDPAIVAEFAHTVYRFGHSMLPQTVARTSVGGADVSLPLIQAFLNPLEFSNGGTPAVAAGAIVRGNVRQVGNELDEFVTDAVRSNLLGLPLDLATINIARGRDTGMPTFQAARRKFFADTLNNSALTPYTSWADFSASGLRHQESLVNFVAAYGKHPTITAAVGVAAKRVAANALVNGVTADAIDFMNSTGTWAAGAPGTTPDGDPATVTGLGDVDFWIGGLAEKQLPFGGLLGSTFNFVFETQMEKLQDADRFYYLFRLAGTNFLSELEANSFAAMISRNTDATHLPGDVFARPDFTIEAGPPNNATWTAPAPRGQLVFPQNGALQFVGTEHIVFGGTPGADNLRANEGDDTLWGDGGNDRLEGGSGNDIVNGGAGDDILNDSFGDDNFKGNDGNDAINAGPGLDLILGGNGNDFIVGGANTKEVFAGNQNDFVHGSTSFDTVFGGAGDDWLEGDSSVDALMGGSGAPFENATTDGNDVLNGQGGNDDHHGEGGDDIMLSGGGVEFNEGMLGFDWVTHKSDPQAADADLNRGVLLPPDLAAIRDRYRTVEGLSGWNQNDVLRGDNAIAATLLGNTIDNQAQVNLISGLQDVLGAGTQFAGGNIILGGAGSDIIEGRAGDDIIDGDKWLDVQLDPDGAGPLAPVDSMGPIQPGVFAGTTNPGDVIINRTIRPGVVTAIDTAEFSGASTEYTFPQVAVVEGSTVVVDHATPGLINDGRDTLTSVERLRFTDRTVVLVLNPNNNPATGRPAILGAPLEGQALTATPGDLADTEGINNIVYSWQVEVGASWVSVGRGPSFTPGPGEVGARLRVAATFQDNQGVSESGTSAPTGAVVNVNDPPTGAPFLSDTSPVVGFAVTASRGSIGDADGIVNATFGFQWQQGSGTSFTNILGATSPTFTPSAGHLGQQLRVRVSYTDDRGAAETVFSGATAAVVAARVAAELVANRVLQPLVPFAISTIRVTPTGAVAKGVRALSSPVLIRFRLRGAATVRLDVRNTKGVLVRRFNRKVKKAGLVTFKWNLNNTKGRRVITGRYRLVVSISNRDGTTRFNRTVQVRS